MKRLLPRFDSLAALLIGLIAFTVRLKGIHGIDLGLDGGLSVALATQPPLATLDFLAHDVHPPVFYFLLHLWIVVFGSTPFAVKFLGVTTGTLAVAALFGAVRRFAGTNAAVVASGLLAISPVAIEVDLTVREYSLAVLLMILAAWAVAERSERVSSRFIIFGTLALWTSYLAVAVPLAVGLVGLARRERDRVLVAATTCATLLPWLVFITASGFLAVFKSSGPRQQTTNLAEPVLSQIRDIFRMLDGGLVLQPNWLGPVGLTAAILLIVLAYRAVTGQRGSDFPWGLPSAWLWIVLLIGALAIGINSLWTKEALGVRYVDPSLPFVFAFIGAGLDRAFRRMPAAIALALGLLVVPNILGILAWYQRPTLPPTFWDPTALVAALDAKTTSDDGVVFVSAEQAGYYEALSQHPRQWVLIPAGTDYLQGNVSRRAEEVLPELSQASRVIWLVDYRGVIGQGTFKLDDWLSTHAFAVSPENLPDSQIDPYVSDSMFKRLAIHTFSGFVFADGVRLDQAELPTQLSPGGTLPVDLRWSSDSPLKRNLTVFVHLTRADGTLVSQHDSQPANGRAPTVLWHADAVVDDHHGLLIPADLTPGEYWVEIGLYDDNGRLPLQRGGDSVRLGPIQVSR